MLHHFTTCLTFCSDMLAAILQRSEQMQHVSGWIGKRKKVQKPTVLRMKRCEILHIFVW